ncbi:MAG: hypothetical protein KC440_03765 [Nitrosarchaeum sp.]|nr:hypothetical protein [Nitrosarchaeum sp.]
MTSFFDLTPIIAYSQWDLLIIGIIGLTCGFLSAYYSARTLVSKSNNQRGDSTDYAEDVDGSKSL